MSRTFYYHPSRQAEVDKLAAVGMLGARPGEKAVPNAWMPLTDSEGKDLLGFWVEDVLTDDWMTIKPLPVPQVVIHDGGASLYVQTPADVLRNIPGLERHPTISWARVERDAGGARMTEPDYQALVLSKMPEARLASGYNERELRVWWLVAAGYPYRECKWPMEAWKKAWEWLEEHK